MKSKSIGDYPTVDALDLEAVPPSTIQRMKVKIISNALGDWAWVPVIVARGPVPGPVLALTAAIHGNELNGTRIIQRMFHRINPSKLRGTLFGVPIMNVPGYRENRREYVDGNDLNRLMPGRENGNCAEVYAHRLVSRVVSRADFLVDLHTASFGRVNAIYVRADMTNPITSRMAMLQQAHIIVHNRGDDGTMRGALNAFGTHAITVEVGDPQRFQAGMIKDAVVGIDNILVDLQMIEGKALVQENDVAICSHSYWTHTDTGGVLEVLPQLLDEVEQGQPIARVSTLFGDQIHVYSAPESGIVVGKSTNPVNRTGSRILHLGIVGRPPGGCEPASTLLG